MITHNRLDDFSSVYTNYLNRLDSNDKTSNTDGYKYYRFVSSPDAVGLFDFGRVTYEDIEEVSDIWTARSGTNTPDAWKIKLGTDYSEKKRNDYSDIEAARLGKVGTNITSVEEGLNYNIIALINKNPKPTQRDPYEPENEYVKDDAVGKKTQKDPSGKKYIKNMKKDLGVNSESDFMTEILNQDWIDSFRSNSDSSGITVDFSNYNKLFPPISNKTIKSKLESNAIGVEWFGYFRPPDVSTQYSFTFSTSNGGNFFMWLGNKAICEYTPANADIKYPNVDFTPNPTVREPNYYPIRIQYYANSIDTLSREFSFKIKNLTSKEDLNLKEVIFTINGGNYFPKLQYLAFVSTSINLFANGAMTCYANDISTTENMNKFYDFINSQKYITLNKKNDKDPTTNDDQFGTIPPDGILYSQVSVPNNPLSPPIVFSIYRMYADMRMNKTFQINTEKDPLRDSYVMNSVDDSLISPGSTYTTLPNYYPDNPTDGINASAAECQKQCTGLPNEDSKCNWFYVYKSNGVNRCIVDSKKTQPTFNQIRPTGGNTANSSIDDKTSSLYLRNYSFPKSKGCGKNSVLLEESESVLNTQVYTDSFPYSTYVIDPKIINTTKDSGKCSDSIYRKLNAEAKNILAVNTDYQKDGKYLKADGKMDFSNYPPYTDKNFWPNIKESFSTTNTNALSDTKKNALDNIAKEQRLGNTNEQINSTYSDLSTNIKNYSKLKTFMENDVNYDLSGNTLLHFRNARKPTLREQNALDSNAGGVTQNSLYILGTITAASLLILAVLLGRE